MQPPPDRAAALRGEVAGLRARHPRGVFDPRVCVGRPGDGRVVFELSARDAAEMDVGLRADVVARLVEVAEPHWDTLLLERTGEPYHHDLDLAWLAAARMAFAGAGRRLAGCYAITRTGWLDVVGGERRTWRRLRP